MSANNVVLNFDFNAISSISKSFSKFNDYKNSFEIKDDILLKDEIKIIEKDKEVLKKENEILKQQNKMLYDSFNARLDLIIENTEEVVRLKDLKKHQDEVIAVIAEKNKKIKDILITSHFIIESNSMRNRAIFFATAFLLFSVITLLINMYSGPVVLYYPFPQIAIFVSIAFIILGISIPKIKKINEKDEEK
jgi:hypothetical protein